MAENQRFRLGRLFVGVLVCGLVIVALVLQSLFAVHIEPIEVGAPPPEIVASILAERTGEAADEELDDVEHIAIDDVSETVVETATESEDVNDVPSRGPDYNAIANDAVLRGEPVEELLRLLSSEDADVRIAAAHALGEAFIQTNGQRGDEFNGYDLKVRFWEQVGNNIESVRNALYEGLISSAERDEINHIPNVIAWMPGQDDESLELFAWTSNHHQSAMMRKSAMHLVVNNYPKSEVTTRVLEERRNDPSFRVRMDALGWRLGLWRN